MLVSGMNFQRIVHLFTIWTEDHRVCCRVAESLQDCCLACVGSPDHENAELSKLCSMGAMAEEGYQALNRRQSKAGWAGAMSDEGYQIFNPRRLTRGWAAAMAERGNQTSA